MIVFAHRHITKTTWAGQDILNLSVWYAFKLEYLFEVTD